MKMESCADRKKQIKCRREKRTLWGGRGKPRRIKGGGGDGYVPSSTSFTWQEGLFHRGRAQSSFKKRVNMDPARGDGMWGEPIRWGKGESFCYAGENNAVGPGLQARKRKGSILKKTGVPDWSG